MDAAETDRQQVAGQIAAAVVDRDAALLVQLEAAGRERRAGDIDFHIAVGRERGAVGAVHVETETIGESERRGIEIEDVVVAVAVPIDRETGAADDRAQSGNIKSGARRADHDGRVVDAAIVDQQNADGNRVHRQAIAVDADERVVNVRRDRHVIRGERIAFGIERVARLGEGEAARERHQSEDIRGTGPRDIE